MAVSFVLTPAGELRKFNLTGNSRERLHQLYAEIECQYVDVVRLTSSIDMWVDDEGMVSEQEINPYATVLAQRFGHVFQPYFGSVVLCGIDGDEAVDLTDDQAEALLRRLSED